MYQHVLNRFAHFNAIQISNPVSLKQLIMLALKEEDSDQQCDENDDLKEKIAEVSCPYIDFWFLFSVYVIFHLIFFLYWVFITVLYFYPHFLLMMIER